MCLKTEYIVSLDGIIVSVDAYATWNVRKMCLGRYVDPWTHSSKNIEEEVDE